MERKLCVFVSKHRQPLCTLAHRRSSDEHEINISTVIAFLAQFL